MLPTIIFRHRKENLKKCSLKGLENRTDFLFYTYPCKETISLENYIVLTLDAPLLTKEDAHFGLCLIDGTWRYAEKMLSHLNLEGSIKRSLPPHYKTAYPRVQTGCKDPDAGLASIEALFLSFHILDRNKKGLLDSYYWKEAFLAKNDLI